MGSDPSAEFFFGITKRVPTDIAVDLEEKFRGNGDVEIESCSEGFDDLVGGDDSTIAAKWKPSKIDSGIDYDHKFIMPVIDVAKATGELIAAWKNLGLKLEQPVWHLVVSYG
jgi:hypothetical protein